MKPHISFITSGKLLTASKLPESDFCINPYVGCLHGCRYCYARFMRRFTGHSGDEWGEFVDVKTFDEDKFRRELSKVKPHEIIFLGSVTDCYQAIERKHKTTRRILEILADYDVSVALLTKSDLVVRDLDILRRFRDCSVGFSLSMLDDACRRRFEPRARPITARLSALEHLTDSGINTYVFIGPILPGFTDLKAILGRVAGHCKGAMAETLNIRCGNRKDLEQVIEQYYPSQRSAFFTLIRDGNYWKESEEQFNELCEHFAIPNLGFFSH